MPRLTVIIFSLFIGSAAVVQAYGPRAWVDHDGCGFVSQPASAVPDSDGFGFDCQGINMFIDIPRTTLGKTWSTRPVQWSTKDGGNGHWYMTIRDITTSSVPWSDARERCEAMGGYLVTLTEARETAFLVRSLGHLHLRAIGLGTFGWIGVMQETDDRWSWVNGEPWGYTNWQCNSVHPVPSGNNPYVVMCGLHRRSNEAMGSWRDRGGAVGRFPMMNCWTIEWSADHNDDGIVDFGQILEGTLADVDGNGIPDCHESGDHCMPGKPDVNGDGLVDLHDFHVVIDGMGSWKQGDADVNCDGRIDADDILGVLLKLGTYQ
ncbi:MAG: lectin-like protein [Phycisphaerales bacterium]|nr:lectin-like protein [Phycisphaerales bacterium]